MQFKDHFSQHAANYAAARPTYPPQLFAFLAEQCQQRQQAWDCATGNGQAAVMLADYFECVLATDASQAQLDQALPHPRVQYQTVAAEQLPLPAASTDLVTVAQALHWFDLERFFATVETVLKPGGMLAVWSYGMTTVSVQVDRVVQQLYEDILGEYWPPERRLVETGYASIQFPFSEIAVPPFAMQCHWSLSQFKDYLMSWSATRRYMSSKQADPLALVADALETAWGDSGPRTVSWPLTFKLRRK